MPRLDCHMAREIAEEPDLLMARAPHWSAAAQTLRPLLAARPTVVVVGRGSSGNAGTFASYLFAAGSGRHPIQFRPWIARQNDVKTDWSDAVALCYSASGRSADVVEVARWLGKRGAAVVAITNAAGPGPLVTAADHTIELGVGEELAVPATKSFCAQLFVTAALCGLEVASAARETAGAMRQLLAGSCVTALCDFVQDGRTVTWMARGPVLAAALDAALKMQEAARIPGAGTSAAEFLHGAIGAFGRDDRVVLLVDSADPAASMRDVVTALGQRRTPCMLLGKDFLDPSGAAAVHLFAPLPSAQWASSAVFAFIAHLATVELAQRRGLDPDRPFGLQK